MSLGTPIRGRTLHRGDDGFEEASSGWLLNVEHRPFAVVIAADADDVAAAVRFAATANRPVAVESTGHGKSVASDGAVFVSTRELRELSVDPRAATARIGAGLSWGEVLTATAEHGLAPLCGSSAEVGVMGFLTGGGLPLACRVSPRTVSAPWSWSRPTAGSVPSRRPGNPICSGRYGAARATSAW
ncbi:FAD-dependent oxidoreductase [Streptomyces sp. A3M-1-3]|uniref:FAD-binding protein n=1 Tax=Streptomyces sp. A3M-1-3 TaxID=2962044 RepID=UPI0020B69040|nr:FAD-binding protein [Streptomyces sp. A3M-1-3]MCP3821466.1 FAD-dependent oxidoreductase [Streptomyces sp. A3M-1-3]